MLGLLAATHCERQGVAIMPIVTAERYRLINDRAGQALPI